ncbi:MAG TPA: cytochrome c oxidase subunit II [Steroidobacteraceae bacterium]|nr:cytochrome c oxidase subunit II [Steroidobacteraceae bacterium]
MSKKRWLVAGGSIAAAVAGLAGPAFAGWDGLNMTKGVTELSEKIYDLHMLIFEVCLVIAAIVFGAMIYALVRFRKSKGAVADTSHVHSTAYEIAWTLLPVAILIAMAVPAARALVVIEDTRNSELTIKVTGYQWKWQYDYLDSGVSFFSTLAESSNFARERGSGIDPNTVENYLLEVDQHVVIPVDTKVRVLLTANDVIHAWWVPALGMKKDAIPGFVNEIWIKAHALGTYRGQCAELCGRDHGFMPIVVDVVSKEDFNHWVEVHKAPAETVPAAPQAQAAPADAAATPTSSTNR